MAAAADALTAAEDADGDNAVGVPVCAKVRPKNTNPSTIVRVEIMCEVETSGRCIPSAGGKLIFPHFDALMVA